MAMASIVKSCKENFANSSDPTPCHDPEITMFDEFHVHSPLLVTDQPPRARRAIL